MFLTGLPNSVLQNAAAKSRDFEATYGKHRKPPENLSKGSSAEKVVVLIQKLNNIVANMKCQESFESNELGCLIELQRDARVLCEINLR